MDHLEPHTRRSYRRGLLHFAEWLASQGVLNLPQGPHDETWQDEVIALAGRYLLTRDPPEPSLIVQTFLQDLLYPGPGRRAYARATVSVRLAALRWAVREARRMGQIQWHLEVDLPSARKDSSGRLVGAPGRDMTGPTPTEADRLLDAARADQDPRALAIMSMLRYEGYREHEIRQLDFKDFDGKFLTMTRKKRSKPSRYPLSQHTQTALSKWIEIRGRRNGPLFYGGPRGSRPARIGKTTIYYLVQRLAEKARVSTSPHKIRHRACTDIVRASVRLNLPEEEILFLTGHSSRAALQPYYDAAKVRKRARAVLHFIDQLEDEHE